MPKEKIGRSVMALNKLYNPQPTVYLYHCLLTPKIYSNLLICQNDVNLNSGICQKPKVCLFSYNQKHATIARIESVLQTHLPVWFKSTSFYPSSKPWMPFYKDRNKDYSHDLNGYCF